MVAALLLLVAVQGTPQTPASLQRFLQQSIGLDAGQIAGMERGEAIVKVLDTRDRRDVAVFGIVTKPIARAAYDRQVRDFQTALRTPTRAKFGIFSTPAAASDVAQVTIDSRDVADMKDCRPGNCVVKLPATDMRRIQDQTNWSAADVQTQLSAFARRRLVEFVSDYRTRGDSALPVYDDRGNMNMRASEAFAAQFAESPYVYQNVPSLERYLGGYPRAALPEGAAEAVFWSQDVLPRLRPILSVTHLVTYTPPELPAATLVAARQIYANHYFEAALDLTLAVDRSPGIYILVLRRYRFDNLPGGILNIRGKAIGALRDQLLSDLRR